MNQIISFDNTDDFFNHLHNVQESAIRATDPSKVMDALGEDQEGSYWVNLTTAQSTGEKDLIIFCRVIGCSEFLDQAEIDDMAYYSSRWQEQKKTGYLLTQCYSRMVPEGEYGDTHVTRLSFELSEDEWNQAKKDNWSVLRGNDITITGMLVNKSMPEGLIGGGIAL